MKYQGQFPNIKTHFTNADCIDGMMNFCKKYADDNSFRYVRWTSDTKTHMCPLCHPEKYKGKPAYKGWQCIGFVTAAVYHGGTVRDGLKCNCSGLTNSAEMGKVTLARFKQRCGNDYIMISNGGKYNGPSIKQASLQRGDILFCYNSKGEGQHLAMYAGDGYYTDCTSGSKSIADNITYRKKKYSGLASRLHVTRAFRYVGIGTGYRLYIKLNDHGDEIKKLQQFLNWALDKSLDIDGAFGAGTKAAVIEFQKIVNITQDGIFGQTSLTAAKAFEKEELAQPYPGPWPDPTTKYSTDNAGKIAVAAENIAWPYGTPEKKWAYKTGAPTSKCSTAMSKYGWKSKVNKSDCGYFVSTAAMQSGVEKNFDCLKGYDWDYSLTNLYIAKKGTSIATSDVKRGDIIRYKKTKGGQHALICLGDGKIAEAERQVRFGVVRKSTKYTGTKKKIEILRAKESTLTRSYMKQGDQGTNVAQWQAFLDWCYDGQVGKAEGIFGPNTHKWTVKFQEEYIGKGQGDGLVGQKTIDAAKKVQK